MRSKRYEIVALQRTHRQTTWVIYDHQEQQVLYETSSSNRQAVADEVNRRNRGGQQ